MPLTQLDETSALIVIDLQKGVVSIPTIHPAGEIVEPGHHYEWVWLLHEYARLTGEPIHPLVSKGYLSIGCAPTTRPVAEGEDPRAGRWSGTGKTECGLHE